MRNQEVSGMNHKPQEPLFTLYAKIFELVAIETAIIAYIRLLEIAVPPSAERTEVIMMLLLFRKRYEEPLRRWQKMPSTMGEEDVLLPVQATKSELMAFGSAVIGYIALLQATVEPCPVRSEVIGHLVRFQKRYLDRSRSVRLDA